MESTCPPRLALHLLAAGSLLIPSAACAVQDSRSDDLDSLQRQIEALSRQVEELEGVLDPSSATDPADRLAWYAEHQRMVESSPHSELGWQFLGPTNVSGRVTDIAAGTPRGQSYTLFAATASSGVWRSRNDGTTWEPVFEHGPSTSVGAVCIAPSQQDTVWIGLGEANIFRSSMAGTGLYRSTDGGDTWEHRGLAATHTIARIVIHPTNPDVVYVAAGGHEWTDNPERGIYRTTDGGEHWEKVLYVDRGTAGNDLVMDFNQPEVLYASTWDRQRKRWNDPRNEPGHTGSGIWRSDDSGDTWTAINEGLPQAEFRGRIGIDVARSSPGTVYAFVDCYEMVEMEGTDSYGRQREGSIKGAQLYRSDDRGETWRQVSQDDQTMRRMSSTYGWVFGQMRVDPTDADTVYVMGLALNVTNDGGETFRRLRGMHGDHHALWIDPQNPQYLVNGNDGGLAISHDGGVNWHTTRDTLPAVQFYNVGYDMDEPFHIYGSIQDHGSRVGVVDLSRGRDRIPATEWEGAPGGEASTHVVDPTDSSTLYAAGFYGSIFRSDLESGDRTRLAPSAPEGEEPLRGQWLAPFLISPHNPRIIYHGMNRLYRSMDRGESFQPISPDLSRNLDEEKGDIPYQTIFSIAESPLRFGLIYAGTDDGRVHVTHDGGVNWEAIDGGLEPERWISRLEASRFDEGTIYCAQNGKRHDDFRAYLWRSTDHGKSWQDIGRGIPSGPINVVREDPTNPDILYVGTDLGVYVTLDGARTWEALVGDLPTTFVHDLVIHPRDDVAVIATHGRGMYALDVRPLRGEEDSVEEEGVTIDVDPAYFGEEEDEEGEGDETEVFSFRLSFR